MGKIEPSTNGSKIKVMTAQSDIFDKLNVLSNRLKFNDCLITSGGKSTDCYIFHFNNAEKAQTALPIITNFLANEGMGSLALEQVNF